MNLITKLGEPETSYVCVLTESPMRYYIKNMTSLNCTGIVKSHLDNLDIKYNDVAVGFIEVPEKIPSLKYEMFYNSLKNHGFDLLDDKKQILVEKIKAAIFEMVHHNNELPNINFSVYLSGKLNYQYTYMANIFSEYNGITIEQFIIKEKVEKVKNMMVNKDLNLKEIAYTLNYSSVAHLSNQFKKITGLRPSDFKKNIQGDN